MTPSLSHTFLAVLRQCRTCRKFGCLIRQFRTSTGSSLWTRSPDVGALASQSPGFSCSGPVFLWSMCLGLPKAHDWLIWSCTKKGCVKVEKNKSTPENTGPPPACGRRMPWQASGSRPKQKLRQRTQRQYASESTVSIRESAPNPRREQLLAIINDQTCSAEARECADHDFRLEFLEY
jgi:hypothetical protein